MKKPPLNEQRVVLSGVNWQQFEALLLELGEERIVHVTYEQGKLEMITPLPERDRCTKLIESLILVLADELNLTVQSIPRILLKAPDRRRAAELDTGFYVDQSLPIDHNLEATYSTEVDVTQHFSPELAIEIVMTGSSFDKLSIYADLGITEVWRYVTKPGDEVLQGELLMYHLQNYQYIQQPNSFLFPDLPAQRVLQFIEQSDTIGLVKALQVLRHWVQER